MDVGDLVKEREKSELEVLLERAERELRVIGVVLALLTPVILYLAWVSTK
jgi:hypothetical protein